MSLQWLVAGFISLVGCPRDPITLSDDDQGVHNHLQNERYLGSKEPFSVSVIGSLGP